MGTSSELEIWEPLKYGSPANCSSGDGGLARRFFDCPLYPRRDGVYWQFAPEAAQRPHTGVTPSHLRCFWRQTRQARSEGPAPLAVSMILFGPTESVIAIDNEKRGAGEERGSNCGVIAQRKTVDANEYI